MINIVKFNSFNPEAVDNIVEQIKYIFYTSSSLKEFSSEERKIAFFKRWCGDYLSRYADTFYLMMEGQKVLGYLSGCTQSTLAEKYLEVPGYSVYSDLFNEYPAHFHINFHPDCRGRGLGSKLVDRFCEELTSAHSAGVHLVTSPGAANISFYQRLGFSREVPRSFNQMTLLFMARKLE